MAAGSGLRAQPREEARAEARRSGCTGTRSVASISIPQVLDRELETIFQRTWQYAGHVGDLPEAGSYLTAIRRRPARARAARRRRRDPGVSQRLPPSRLAAADRGSGRCKKAIRCRYHGWTYDATDGRLLGVPEHRGFAELDKSRLGLDAGAGRGAGRAAVRQPRPGCALARRGDRRVSPRGSSATGSPTWCASRTSARPASRRTGSWSPRTTSRAITCRSPIPSLMRLLRLQALLVRAPRRLGLVRRADARLAFGEPARAPLSASRPADARARARGRRVWRYAFVYPNTTIDLHPDQVNVWQMVPAGIDMTRDVWGCFGPSRRGPLTRLAQRLNNHVNSGVLDEDIDLVAARPERDPHPRLPARAAGRQGGGGGVVRRPDPRGPRARGRPMSRLELDPRERGDASRSRSSGRRCCRRASFTDEGVLAWELEHIFRGWICVGHAVRRRRARHVPDARDRRRERLRDRRRGRAARGLLQRLPPPRRADRRGGRGERPQADPLPVPRLVLRPRRQRSRRRRHMAEVEDFDSSCWGLIPVRPRSSAACHGRPLRRGAGGRRATSASCSATSSATGSLRSPAPGAIDYEVEANWKAIAENYNECLHCPGVHPELKRSATTRAARR